MYRDDILTISHHLKEPMSQLNQHFQVKADSIKVSETYLGARIA